MKILAYSSYYKPYTSGLTVYLERVLKNLGAAEVTVLTFKHGTALPELERSTNITTIRMPSLFKVSKGFISPQSLLYFFREVKGASAVIINLPNAEALPLALLAKLFRKPITVIYHCDVDLGSGLFSKIVKRVLDFCVSAQLKTAQNIVACPDYIEERPFYDRLSEKITQAIPPIEVVPADDLYRSRLKEIKGEKKWIGFVGRIAREKGLEYLIDAADKLDEKSIELVIVTPKDTAGESSYRLKIMKKLQSVKFKYHILSDLGERELGAVYELLDVLALPSVNQTEAFGMVQAEAMLHGTPCIATDMPGVRVPIKVCGAGLIVPPADPVKLSETISIILAKRLSRKAISQKAAHVFNPEKTYEVFKRLLLRDK